MNRVATILLLLAATLAGAVDKKGTVEELKARFESASPKDQVELGVVIAERQLAVCQEEYGAGMNDKARAALEDVQTYGVRAAKLAASTGKHMKKTEITLRKISDRLDEMAKSLDLELRPPVQEAHKQLEIARNDLLLRMFK